jgi:CRP/FNR family transcriptional regulator
MAAVSATPGASGNELRRRREILRATPPFSALEGHDLVALAASVEAVAHAKGQVIFRVGEPAEDFFVVRTGQVKLTSYGPSRHHRLIGIVGPRQIFGEPGIVDHGPRAMDAEAMEDCSLLSVSADAFWNTVESSPAFARTVIELMGSRLRRADRAAQDLVFFDASTRLARKLVDLAEDYGRPTKRGTVIRTRMTQRDLAHMTGMARPNVNRLLASFAADGWIDWNDGRPIILRLDLLVAHAK